MKPIEFNIAFDLVKNTNLSFFLTGRAGTGKSTFLKEVASTVDKNFVILAPTGISALNVKGATIHSFFQLPPRPLLPRDKGIKTFWEGSEKRKLIKLLDTLIIDEASMVRADVIEAIDFSLRKNGGNPSLPFGGKQVIFVGDLYQLEPIVVKKKGETYTLEKTFEGPRFYHAHVFKHLKFFTVELKQVFRQTDPVFVGLLDKIRIKTLNQTELNKLNSRVLTKPIPETGKHILTLTATVEAANRINQFRLSKLEGDSRLYEAEVSGDFDVGIYPSDVDLNIKIGTQVIFIRNDSENRWVNGSLGIVVGFSDSIIRVELEDGVMCEVEREVWENVKYKFNKNTNKVEQEVVGSYKQFPIKPAWAITIHKSQGMTFDRLAVDFGEGTFACGQAYVALSRVRSFEGLFLNKEVQFSDIQVDQTVGEFLRRSRSNKLDTLSIEGKREYDLLSMNNWISVGNYYLREALNDIIESDFKRGYEHILKAYAYTSNDQDFSRDVDFLSLLSQAHQALKSASQTSLSYRFNLLKGVVLFLLGEYNTATQTLSPCLKQDTYSVAHYLTAKSLWYSQDYRASLDKIDQAISLIQNSRNLFFKSTILNPYLEENQNNDLVNKSLCIENSLISYNLDITNLEAYKEIKTFLTREGFKLSLPTVESFENEIHKERPNLAFFDSISESLKKNKRRLLQWSGNSKSTEIDADFISESIVSENEEMEDEVSEEELMEDMLDEFLDDDTMDYY